MHETPQQREVREAEDATFRTLHANCHTARIAMQGSPIHHCTECCPPFPMSPETAVSLRTILASAGTNPNLVRWTLSLSCGHEHERAADHQHVYSPATSPFTEVYRCPTCDEQRCIISVQKLGPVRVDPPRRPRASRAPKAAVRREILQLEQRLAELKSELE